jgi:hypothetical protein
MLNVISSEPGIKQSGQTKDMVSLRASQVLILLQIHSPRRSVHRDRLSIADAAGGVRDVDDGGQAILARDDRAMRELPADLEDEAGDEREGGRPAGVGRARDEDVAGVEAGGLPGLARMRAVMFAAVFVVNACLAYDGYKEAQAINGKQAVA